VALMTDATLDEIVGTLGRVYSSYGLSPPYELRRTAASWTGIPLADIIGAIELHMLHHRRLYGSGSGDAYFGLVRRAVDQLRNKHLHAEDAHPKPSPRRAASRTRRPVVTKLYRGAGYVEAFLDDDREVSPPDAPQPFLTREPRGQKVDYVGSLEDDDVEDGAA
jgi:hypothetical protein